MPRRPRIEVPGGISHVNQRATDDQILFADAADHERFERLLVQTARRYEWEIRDYCELTNHFHLLVLTREPTLARGMQYLNARYVEAFNRRYDRRGALVQGRYYSRLVQTDEQYLTTRAYIAFNPVEAGLCRQPDEWPWSGFGGRGRIVPAPNRRLREFVAHYGAHRRLLAAMARRDMSQALTPGQV